MIDIQLEHYGYLFPLMLPQLFQELPLGAISPPKSKKCTLAMSQSTPSHLDLNRNEIFATNLQNERETSKDEIIFHTQQSTKF